MPTPPKEGQVIIPESNNRLFYTIIKHLNKGNMANAYEASDVGGKKVFLKAYISPTPALPWYKDFISYTEELKTRVNESKAGRYCVMPTNIFEAKIGKCPFPTYFQVFEFIEGGHDLDSLLKSAEKTPRSLLWQQRIDMAKVTLMSLSALHEAKIVHGDLKPPNIQLFYDPSIGIKYRPMLIDMDFSFFEDKRAPWDGSETTGYIGSPNYYSPEHLANKVPQLASDVFTTTLILYELLGQGNPFHSQDPEIYKSKATTGKAPPIQWQGALNDEAQAKELADLLLLALSPAIAKRPAMEQLRQALLPLKAADPTFFSVPPSHYPALPLPVPPLTPPTPAIEATFALEGDKGRLSRRIKSTLGRLALMEISSEGVFASHEQFEVRRQSGKWFIKANENAKNATLLNGTVLVEETQLNDTDKICLKGKTKTAMELTVFIS